ncbi:hypothetical protein GR212_36650 [Rhizobium lusitanum]|uniref:Uncharacterized protein n=2 Tax=Rhizobium lusitanum TaxID=293958 RepID=A0A6L9UI55_9HYPH|nr:hypothetical protein [Rhizobium lusitanum]
MRVAVAVAAADEPEDTETEALSCWRPGVVPLNATVATPDRVVPLAENVPGGAEKLTGGPSAAAAPFTVTWALSDRAEPTL